MPRVTTVEAFRLSLPLVHAFQTSSHRKTHLEHILVRVADADGAVGWGEIASPSDPYYCSETVDICWLTLQRYLAPALRGADWDHPAQVRALWKRVRGHHFAKAGLDIACWDLWSRAAGTPLARALGGDRRAIEAGVSLGIEPTIDDLLVQVGRYAAEGYRRIKLKIAPGWDVEPVRAVRAAHPGLPLHVDANGAYGEDQSEVFTALDRFGLTMIEQPYAPGALAAHARLQARLETPVCLDESVDDLDQLDTALELGAGRVLNIKVSRMGGLTVAGIAHDRAVEAGWRVWCGGMHEFGVGRAANVAIAALPGFTLPSDVSGSDKYYAHDVVEPPIRATEGRVPVPETPGLGHEIDEPLVRRLASATLTV
ncbi:o-succinylbenzoate synthase [Actinoallomurus iriomotensis]|uniref:o-succinylbenzoate synthase n=1 Tax=Actinoallomurus iriomotensis TaxID=478107 RepID=A0A9W6SDL9_9ACTN|nr:o-succinylbenzoate synthase [Actinoallomurus iriomotensis]GLY76465.1 o-succinylbenzoate synthase [Actinoallomurus iriomotensis]GLY91664.1 o-succinylbenzoate synthase [Actinoallomurus iriomotensis]